jgi:uncharacterized RDD family membrane protein YckC
MFASPSVFRRIAAMLYESVLLFAILFVAGVLYRAVFSDPSNDIQRHFLFLYCWLVSAFYFIYCWVKSGQTLAMQTWRVRLVNREGDLINFEQALKRYVLASFCLMFFGLGFVWAWFDREGLYLHDRLTGCRLLVLPKRHE